MNRIFLLPVVAATALLASCSSETKTATPEANAPKAAPEPVALFNGQNLDGWSHVLVGDVAMQDVWSVADGVIVCKGEPLGFLHTKESYQDYTLTFEWRWAPGKEPGNSGVLLRIASEAETFMPKCVEAQLKHGSAGDIWAFHGAGIKNDGERAREVKANPNLGDFKGVAKIKDAEKPPGEWNRYEITVSGDTLTLRINGELVNEASGLDIVSGPIGFQSEGAEIHFRNIALQKL
jgi:hypothetical protein